MRSLVFVLLAVTLSQVALAQDRDSDRDGLSDYREIHKYLTDWKSRDSDGDGIPDGDWHERREYTYTVRSILHVMPPYDLDAMNDDYQDIRVLEERADYAEVEVIHYPFNTWHEAITENRNWRRDYASMKEYLRPGITTNWDQGMRRELLAALKKDGIEVEKLTDRAAVESVSEWLMKNSRYEDGFTTFAFEFENGKPVVCPGLEQSLERELERSGRSLEDNLERELYGKGMFENRVRGSCTSSAIFLSTCLRAIGIPTRTVICVPVVDASDPTEVAMVRNRLTHHQVRRIIEENTAERGSSWASHTFNEVYVGDRWRRLNYQKLGQGILDRQYLGLMTHVNTFTEHADAGLARTWGLRNATRPDDDVFGHSNPYSCISLSDLFGSHASIDNPPAGGRLTKLTISRLYWYDDEDKHEIVQMKLDDPDTAGHLLAHVEEGDPGEGSSQYRRFYGNVGKDFLLRSDGLPDVPVVATRGYWVRVEQDVKEFYLKVRPADLPLMKRGAEYRLVALDGDGECRWTVREGVGIIRP